MTGSHEWPAAQWLPNGPSGRRWLIMSLRLIQSSYVPIRFDRTYYPIVALVNDNERTTTQIVRPGMKDGTQMYFAQEGYAWIRNGKIGFAGFDRGGGVLWLARVE